MPKARNFDPDIILLIQFLDLLQANIWNPDISYKDLANGNIVLFLEQPEVESHVDDEDIELMAACKNFTSVLRVLKAGRHND